MARFTAVLVGLLTAALVGCSGEANIPATTVPSTTSPTDATTTSSPAPTTTLTTTQVPVDRIVLDEPSQLDPSWTELFTLPYGDAPDHLGTSLGGDGEGIMWGPEYGTQMPGGTWWFLDAARSRLAEFSETGAYLGEVVLPEEYLADGEYFQYQRPQALADGTLVLSSSTPGAPGMLLMAPDHSLAFVPLAEFVGIHANDGHLLYGFNEAGALVGVDPITGAVEEVTAFAGQTGEQYAIAVGEGLLDITRPGVGLHLPVLAAAHPEALVHPSIEAVMGSDGVLSILVLGLIEAAPGDISTVIGCFTVDRDGRVSPAADIRDPSSASDPGTGSHLGIQYGDHRPWLMFIDTDAVRVYRREG